MRYLFAGVSTSAHDNVCRIPVRILEFVFHMSSVNEISVDFTLIKISIIPDLWMNKNEKSQNFVFQNCIDRITRT